MKTLLSTLVLAGNLVFNSYGQPSYNDADSTKIFLKSSNKKGKPQEISLNIYFPNDYFSNGKNIIIFRNINNHSESYLITDNKQIRIGYKKKELKKMFKEIKKKTKDWPAGEYPYPIPKIIQK